MTFTFKSAPLSIRDARILKERLEEALVRLCGPPRITNIPDFGDITRYSFLDNTQVEPQLISRDKTEVYVQVYTDAQIMRADLAKELKALGIRKA